MGWYPFYDIITVPTGATTGERIVINGVDGTITMYDATNAVTGLWSAPQQAFFVFDGSQLIELQANAGVGPALSLQPNNVLYQPGQLYAIVGGGQPELALVSPFPRTGVVANAAQLIIGGRSTDGTITSLVTVRSDGPGQNGAVMSESTWTAIPFNAGFQSPGFGKAVGYKFLSPNIIRLRGTFARTVGNLVSGDIPITVPISSGGASSYHSCAAAAGGGGQGVRVQVDGAGGVTVVWATAGYTPAWASLDGIIYDLN